MLLERSPAVQMVRFLRKFEKGIIIALLAMMVLVVFLSTLELAVIIFERIFDDVRLLLLDITDLLTIFGFFMLILIGLELMETMKAYLEEGIVHVEIIFLVAITAMTRKVIILDAKALTPLALIGVASIILALSVGYFVVKKAMDNKKTD